MGSASAPASGSSSSSNPLFNNNSGHRIHPPPSSSTRDTYLSQGQYRVHPPPYTTSQSLSHPYAVNGVRYLPDPDWTDVQPSGTPFTEVNDDQHEEPPLPFGAYPYPGQQTPFPLSATPSFTDSQPQPSIGAVAPLGEVTINTLMTPHANHSYEYPEGEDEISPALSMRMIGDLPIDPSLDDEDVGPQVDQDDEYQPVAAKKGRKGKGKSTGGGRKGKGKATGNSAGGNGRAKKPAASQRRTTFRGEARPVPPTAMSSLSTLPGLDDTPFEVYDTDSHINVAYFPGLKNVNYPLLAAPPGTHLDVNDLLILHPPALSMSDDSHIPVNQYNKPLAIEVDKWYAEMGKSKWEMYTCRACRKTYDGKNARSVSRRHLQDKHGIPLSQQARRTRWDGDTNRPVDAVEASERSKKCKRDWAKVMRQQRSLEKLHGDFLVQFGPAGLKTSWKHPLVAPVYRDSHIIRVNDGPWKSADEVKIPRSLVQSAALLTSLELAIEENTSVPFVSFEDLLELDSDTDTDMPDGKKKMVTSNGSLLTLPTSPLRPNYQPYPSTPVSAARDDPTDGQIQLQEAQSSQHGPFYDTYDPTRILQPINNDVSPSTTYTQNVSPDYSIRPTPTLHAANDTGEDEEYTDGHPPLWVRPDWQEWHEYPSTSSAGLREIGQALLEESQKAAEGNASATQLGNSGDASAGEQVDVEEVGLVADSLLDMHSTPLRAGDSSRSPTPEPLVAALLEHARLAIEDEQRDQALEAIPEVGPATQAPWMNGIAQLIADYASNPSRSTSIQQESTASHTKHPFLRPHPHRSLSNSIMLDDPFLESPDKPQPKIDSSSHRQARSNTNARFAHTLLTGSPMVKSARDAKKRKAPPASPAGHLRPPLKLLAANRSHSTGAIQSTFNNSRYISPKKGNETFLTPLRPSRKGSTVNPSPAGWMQFSSPADPAASLGLVPTHAVATTPGLSMIIGQDTPVAAGGKKRRGEGVTPSLR